MRESDVHALEYAGCVCETDDFLFVPFHSGRGAGTVCTADSAVGAASKFIKPEIPICLPSSLPLFLSFPPSLPPSLTPSLPLSLQESEVAELREDLSSTQNELNAVTEEHEELKREAKVLQHLLTEKEVSSAHCT